MDLKNLDLNNISGTYFDEEGKKFVVFTKNILINQLKRKCPEIANSFDALCEKELNELSLSLSKSAPLIYVGLENAYKENNELLITCGILLTNALNTAIAAVQILRNGFRLQSGMLLRNVVESSAVSMHLITKPDELTKFKNGTYKSTTAIGAAEKVLPIFGRIWGHFSNQFTHIGSLYLDVYPVKKFEDNNEPPLYVTLGMLGVVIWVLSVISELVFIDSIESPVHWEQVSTNQVKFTANIEEMYWIEETLGREYKP